MSFRCNALSHRQMAVRTTLVWRVDARNESIDQRSSLLTSEMSEGCVGLEVKTFPVLVEGLQAELTRLLHGPHSHIGQHSRHIMAAANLHKSYSL